MDAVRELQTALFAESLAPWTFKGSAWLDINCGDGTFLSPLLHKRCNVEATERDATLRAKAREATNKLVDIAATGGEHLPYGDNYFDYAVLHMQPDDVARLSEVVMEMARVAERGIAVTFWNSASLGAMGNFAGMATQPLPWWQVRAALKGVGRGAYAAYSTLWLPAATWQNGGALAWANNLCSMLPIGAWMIAKLDLKPRRTGTPLALRIPFLRSGDTAMNS